MIGAEKHHALFAESDQQCSGIPALQQGFSHAKHRGILRRRVHRFGHDHSGRGKGLGTVGFDGRDTGPFQWILGIGIACDQNSKGFCLLQYRIDKRLVEQSLAIIFKKDGISLLHQGAGLGKDILTVGKHGSRLLPVNADHLLPLRDDTGLDDGRHRRIDEESRRRDSLLTQQMDEFFPRMVGSHDSQHGHRVGKFPQIAGDVGSAPWVPGLAPDLHHRNGRLRRDAGHITPDKLIEHQVSHHKEAFGGGGIKNVL